MPRKAGSAVDASLLEAALVGFEQMRRNLEEKMAEIRRQLGAGDGAGAKADTTTAGAKRTLSAAARRRIAAAQRRRWVLAKAKQAAPKRTMSAAARKRIAAAQRKRWAAVKANAKAATKRAGKKLPVAKVGRGPAKAAS
jgi:hypothetical protein